MQGGQLLEGHSYGQHGGWWCWWGLEVSPRADILVLDLTSPREWQTAPYRACIVRASPGVQSLLGGCGKLLSFTITPRITANWKWGQGTLQPQGSCAVFLGLEPSPAFRATWEH